MEVDSETTTNTTAPQEKKEEKKKNEDHRYKFEFTRAIKENHGRPIVDVAWNPFKDGERYYATVGANQVLFSSLPFGLGHCIFIMNARAPCN